ncbi:MAG: hypothetical protein GQ570_03635 [Helicobacteraceae bacterium]|nr:hypothetical protein [Helicobacteraceae bacterium]
MTAPKPKWAHKATTEEVKPSDEVWTMKDGTKIEVKDMEESHAKNCLRMLIRKITKFNQAKQHLSAIDHDAILMDIYSDKWGDK